MFTSDLISRCSKCNIVKCVSALEHFGGQQPLPFIGQVLFASAIRNQSYRKAFLELSKHLGYSINVDKWTKRVCKTDTGILYV